MRVLVHKLNFILSTIDTLIKYISTTIKLLKYNLKKIIIIYSRNVSNFLEVLIAYHILYVTNGLKTSKYNMVYFIYFITSGFKK